MALRYPATNSTLEGISAISPFALATALLVASLLGWSVGLTPSPEYVYFRAFSRQSRPCRLPDITTAPHWDLRRRDLHPQVQQLASLHHPFPSYPSNYSINVPSISPISLTKWSTNPSLSHSSLRRALSETDRQIEAAIAAAVPSWSVLLRRTRTRTPAPSEARDTSPQRKRRRCSDS